MWLKIHRNQAIKVHMMLWEPVINKNQKTIIMPEKNMGQIELKSRIVRARNQVRIVLILILNLILTINQIYLLTVKRIKKFSQTNWDKIWKIKAVDKKSNKRVFLIRIRIKLGLNFNKIIMNSGEEKFRFKNIQCKGKEMKKKLYKWWITNQSIFPIQSL